MADIATISVMTVFTVLSARSFAPIERSLDTTTERPVPMMELRRTKNENTGSARLYAESSAEPMKRPMTAQSIMPVIEITK